MKANVGVKTGGSRVGGPELRSTYPYRQACLPRQGKSHPDTGRSLQSCIFIVQESGGRTPSVAPEPGFNDDESGA
ncbi:hypothetical protein T12_4493 [Trichinella patagoniensis]|uniref:Uncharacterized protein n=1 Tax=Trichinella patagoniensis TaxID=990121 RepID=A0A0V0Z116_9BILA|nr:hypothetical protein T12_4493 [Trichinella patagoniensis]